MPQHNSQPRIDQQQNAQKRKEVLTYGLTSDERVSREPGRAATDRVVIHHLAPGSDATGSGTGIPTFLVAARLILTALRTHYALRPASRRAAYEARHARAHGLAVYFAALAVGAAGRGIARQRHHGS